MKRIFTFFFALLSACTFSAYAAVVDGTCGTSLTWTLNTKDSTLTISGTGAMADNPSWSDYRSYIKYVTLPDGLTSIGNSAFLFCESLTSITIPNSVTSIGNQAFRDCSSLTSVTIGNSVTSIGYQAFGWCSSLTSVVWNAENCADFSSSSYAPFYDISSQITSFTFGDSVKHILAYLCYGMNKLTSITIPNSVTSIGGCAFSGCSGLTSITIPNSVTSIGNAAFSWCESLTSITIPNSVTSIGRYAFQGCSSLTSITIPNSVTSIGDAAFEYCSALTSVTIGNSVTSIGYYAFCDCSSLTTVICKASNVPVLGEYVFYDMPLSEATLYVPAQSLDDYKAADQWNDFGTILPLDKAPSAVENTRLPIANSIKLLRNGQVYILQDGKTYTTTGQKL